MNDAAEYPWANWLRAGKEADRGRAEVRLSCQAEKAMVVRLGSNHRELWRLLETTLTVKDSLT